MKIGLVPLVSPIPGQQSLPAHGAVEALSREFEVAVLPPAEMRASDLPAFLIRTGGTEEAFRRAFAATPPTRDPVTLLAVDTDNSLPASLEILAWLRRQGHRQGRIILLTAPDAFERLRERAFEVGAVRELTATRLGVIGRPSDWLIASLVDHDRFARRWGAALVDVDIADLGPHLDSVSDAQVDEFAAPEPVRTWDAERGRLAIRIYLGLRSLARAHGLTALTLRCFDLLGSLRSTGCLALALLNDDGFVAGCEGDVPTTFTMLLNRIVTGRPSFMANPSSIEGDDVVCAHCTAPLSLLTGFSCDSHFESGLGVAIEGTLPQGPVTVSRLGGEDLSEALVFEGELVHHVRSPHLCRTQVRARVPGLGPALLAAPLGNHLVLSPGHHRRRLESVLALGNVSIPAPA